MSDTNPSRRTVLKLAGATGGIALVSSQTVEASQAAPNDDLHDSFHDLGVYNNSDETVSLTVSIQGDTRSYERRLTLPGIGDQAADNADSRFIGAVSTPGRGWYEVTVTSPSSPQSVTEEVLLTENGVPEFGTLGVYVTPGGELRSMWSMA